MKLVTDPNLIQYRIGLQSRLFGQINDFALFISELQERMKKFPLNLQEAGILYDKIVTISNMYYEIAFGGYFAKQDYEFKKDVYQTLVKIYSAVIFDQSIKDMRNRVGIQIFIDLENVLKEKIKERKNGKQSN